MSVLSDSTRWPVCSVFCCLTSTSFLLFYWCAVCVLFGSLQWPRRGVCFLLSLDWTGVLSMLSDVWFVSVLSDFGPWFDWVCHVSPHQSDQQGREPLKLFLMALELTLTQTQRNRNRLRIFTVAGVTAADYYFFRKGFYWDLNLDCWHESSGRKPLHHDITPWCLADRDTWLVWHHPPFAW